MSMKDFHAWVQSGDYDKSRNTPDFGRHQIDEHDGEYMTAAEKRKAEKGKSTPEWYKGRYEDGKWVSTTKADVLKYRKEWDSKHKKRKERE